MSNISHKLLTDFHLHNYFSSDGKGTVKDFCQKALSKNINNLCFTNHAEKFSQELQKYRIDIEEFSSCYTQELNEIKKAKQKYEELNICLGIEFENRWQYLKEMEYIIENFDFDVILGSLHLIDNISISNKNAADYLSKHSEDYVYNKYFEELLSLLTKIEMDVLAHFDIVKRYGSKVFGKFLPQKYQQKIEEILISMKKKNIILEVNTSGLSQEPRETYPGREIISWALEIGLEVMVGSDAHSPLNIGAGIKDAYALLKDIGYTDICIFKNRQKVKIDI